jgi:hypothetical protein
MTLACVPWPGPGPEQAYAALCVGHCWCRFVGLAAEQFEVLLAGAISGQVAAGGGAVGQVELIGHGRPRQGVPPMRLGAKRGLLGSRTLGRLAYGRSSELTGDEPHGAVV